MVGPLAYTKWVCMRANLTSFFIRLDEVEIYRGISSGLQTRVSHLHVRLAVIANANEAASFLSFNQILITLWLYVFIILTALLRPNAYNILPHFTSFENNSNVVLIGRKVKLNENLHINKFRKAMYSFAPETNNVMY